MRFQRIDRGRDDGYEQEKPTLEAVFGHYDLDYNPERAIGMAPCPLHEDRTPSFSYNLDRQVWKCHSCQRGGDSYEFIIHYETTVNRNEIAFVGAKSLAASLGLATSDAGGGDERLSGSSYSGRRKVSAEPRDRKGRGGYVPAWRRR
ncbi:CHC2 zinc finger domain-containing protein [Streptomyces sp. ET3-23]|uniref:CHC2 zinc finger domain-containing protein n=1 Tax=Streptomyces sp. ET3-23 TaxID=2885643 RepID=UPI001D10248B|nr:CHC2 zinc finger domain-containing protein [Streptomyces sp. ET3-23]MCC2278867.1 CHC2 zinc finger domain-containing protein [Streptomyces sp. ET3-23]